MKIILSLVGLYIGAVIDDWEGAIFGFFIGLLSGAAIQIRNRVYRLEQQLARQNAERGDEVTATPAETPLTPPQQQPQQTTEQETQPATPAVTQTVRAAIEQQEEQDEEDTTLMPPDNFPDASAVTTEVGGATEPPLIDRITHYVKDFFTSGNVVVKVGVIVLFFGVAFLLKYAAERNVFPIELRLAAVALGGVVMLIIGWRLRRNKPTYALVLQGGAVGVLYLTVFTAARMYTVLPLEFALLVMIALVVFSCALAVIQDSRSLAIFATVGGFLAPVLTSTGGGSHVALFSYYALLNAGILGIAWYKSWRSLNWVGFLFTFVIASLWGYRYYQPQYFNSTEPFLVLFFLFYIAIAILFAHRQPPQLKGLVDGTLVFGTPLVGFTLQYQLVKDFEFGHACSALAMAAVYMLLAKVLWKKQVAGMRLLTEAFLALGVIFATLTIPLALDGRWTAAAWSLEGAGVIWMGIRQHRLIPRAFGLLLQVGAAIAFLSEVGHPHANIAVFNSAYIGSVMISIAALFTGLQYYRHGGALKTSGEKHLNIVLLLWGLCWWFGAGFSEIDAHLAGKYELNASLLFIAASCLLISVGGRYLRWPAAVIAALILLPAMSLLAAIAWIDQPYKNPFSNYGYISWIGAFVIQYLLMYRSENAWPKKLMALSHSWTLWLVSFIFAWTIAHAVSHYVQGLHRWDDIFWGLVPALVIFILMFLVDKQHLQWPLKKYPGSYYGNGLFPLAVYLAVWTVVVCFNANNPAPLPYIPILNPHDITQLFSMLVLYDWINKQRLQTITSVTFINAKHMLISLGVIAFAWLNAVVAHGVHFYGGVYYNLDSMFNSELFQSSISIVWTLTAFALMGTATRIGWRRLWFTGGVLLAAVVVKLFTIDLADSGTIARIVSFLTVGGLMLIIGYLSPVPPRQQAEQGA